MATRRTIGKGLLLGSLVVVAIQARALPAHSAGFYNVPSRLAQCLGYGPGPGYHAPLVLGSAYSAGTANQPIIRLDAAPAPPPRSRWTGWHTAPEHFFLPYEAAPPISLPPASSGPPAESLFLLPPAPAAAPPSIPTTPAPPSGQPEGGREDLPSPSDRVLGLRRLPPPPR